MADEKILIQIDVDNEKAQQSLTEQTRKVDLLKEANKKLLKENKELAKQGSVTAKQRSENSKQIALNRSKIADSNATIKDSIKTLKTQNNSYGAMKVRLKEVTKAIDQVDLSTIEGAESAKKLREEQNQLNTALKAGEAEGNSFTRNVGNYVSKVTDATGATGGFGGALDGVGQVIKLNPIGLLVSGLVALVAAFGKTEKGAKFFTIAGEVLNQLFNELVGLLGSVGTALTDLNFEEIGNSIKTYLVDQVKLVIKGFGLLGDAFSKLFEGDFNGAVEAAGEGLKTLYIEANPLAQVIGNVADATVDFTKKVVENTEKTINNASARFDLNRSILETQKLVAKQIQEEERLNKIADDSTLSLNKQKKANEDYETALNKRLGTELNLLEQEQKILQIDVDKLKSAKIGGQELLDARQLLADKQIEISQKETEQQQAAYDQQQRGRQINQDQWEQDLDFIIDIGARRADNLLKQSENEKLSTAERQKAFEDYQAAIIGVREGIISSFEDSGLSEEEFNRLLGIRDPEQLAEEIRKLDELSEIENNRLKEGLQEFLIIQQEEVEATRNFEDQKIKIKEDAGKKEKKLRKDVSNASLSLASTVFKGISQFLEQGSKEQKAFAIADATINTAKGVTNALSTGVAPLNFINAASVATAGAVQIASIAATTPGSGGGTTAPVTAQGTAQQQANTNAIDQQLSQQEALINATNNIGLRVSVTEINEVQNNVAISEETATI